MRHLSAGQSIVLNLAVDGSSVVDSLTASSCLTGACADELLRHLIQAKPVKRLDLVRTTLGMLGFDDVARFREICAQAMLHGLNLCPALVGPMLRLSYPSQARGDWLYVAMAPLPDVNDDPCIFSLDCDSEGRWLRGMVARSETRFHPEDSFLFARTGAST